MWRDLGLTKRDWDRTPPAVRSALLALHHQVRLMNIRFTAYEQQIADLKQQVVRVDDLEAEVAELKERLGQNSHNSHRPPSTDPPAHKPAAREAKEPKLKRGGQPGHQGQTRSLRPVEEVDHLIEVCPTICAQCGRRLRGEDPEPERRQVWEVPPIKTEVAEYRRHTLCCARCGTPNKAAWPAQAQGGSFGPRAQAVISYLTGRFGASHRDCVEAMSDLFGMSVGVGSVAAIQRRVSQVLRTPVEAARDFVQQQQAQYVDETSWDESGESKWLWVNAAKEVSVFAVLGGRGQREASEVLSATAKGVVTTDRYAAYNWLPARRRQICWAHLKRDFQAFIDRGAESAEVGEGLLAQAKRVFELWHQVRDGTLSRAQLEKKSKRVRRKIKELLERGSRSKQAKTRRTCSNILKVEASLWTFVRVRGVEPTNNAAERALRRAVLWRRKSFGTQSTEGSRFVGRILTAVTSLRQQGRDVLEYLRRACQQMLTDGKIERLTPKTT